jgi:hypothetical protein
MARYTKFNSNYLMRSQRQHTEFGTLLERDWVTTNGANVLRFGSGRKIWYESGGFVFTTSIVPNYHKKHKLSTETTAWKWDNCETADSTVNTVLPTFNTTDMRDYAYYGSCVELVRATIEDIISDFPGCMSSGTERPIQNGPYVNEWYKTVEELLKEVVPSEGITSYDEQNDVSYYYIGDEKDGKWEKSIVVGCDRDILLSATTDMIDNIYYVQQDGIVKQLKAKIINDKPHFYLEYYGIPTTSFSLYYIHSTGEYYGYDYVAKEFKLLPLNNNLVYGYLIDNPFQIDLHHKKVTLGKYDNPMRFMSNSWKKYCVKIKRKNTIANYQVAEDFTIDTKEYKKDDIITIEEYNKLGEYQSKCKAVYNACCCGGESSDTEYCLFTGNVIGYNIEDREEYTCKSENEGRVLKEITFETDNHNIQYVKVEGYYLDGTITYIYNPTQYGETITIQPQQEYIDEYFNGLTGFKKQLLRQDTKPLYQNKFITPTEANHRWYYPVKTHTWPSHDYCIDVDTSSFTEFVGKLYDIAQVFDDLWSDNLYRSMTHESIKNFDWSYSREYYEGDEQDNIDGGERMQKIIRVLGRVFDDIKVYIDTLKLIPNVTYDKYKNCPEALLSDSNDVCGFDTKTTISSFYDLDANVDSDFLNTVTKGPSWQTKDDAYTYTIQSNLKKWYSTRNSTDIYPDIADNEFMRRMLLSAKRIMQSKGTQESIEMVFGLFGFGKDVDYTITEEAYFTEKLIRSDECMDGTIDGEEWKGEDWSQTLGVDWKDVDSKDKGDLAEEINRSKDKDILYNDYPLSGTAMREVHLGRQNNVYLVPYYDQTQLYDDNLIFQGKGGWGKMIKNGDNDPLDDMFDYQETLSYLHVVGTVSELLSLNQMALEDNDIYYVVSLSDYTSYDENMPIDMNKNVTMSHYFILRDSADNSNLYSWKNIVVQTSLDANGNLQKVDKDGFETVFGVRKYRVTEDFKQDGVTYKKNDYINEETYAKLTDENKEKCTEFDNRNWRYEPDSDDETETEKLGTYKYAFKKMQYIDGIFSTNLGNNPHVGYGMYDDGSKYIEYMKLPFKYLVDNSNLLTNKDSLYELSKKYSFDDINGYKVLEDFTDGEDEYKSGEIISQETYATLSVENQSKCERSVITDKIQIVNSRNKDSDFVRYTTTDDTISKKYIDTYSNAENRWYINSKVLTIENLVKDNDKNLFGKYFRTIIMPYVMQVIPSTTILKLKGFS